MIEPRPTALLGNSPRHTPRTRLRIGLLLLSTPLLLLLLVPIVAIIVATPPSLIARTIGRSEVGQAVGLSLGTSLATVVIVAILGLPLALLLARRQFRGQRLMLALVDLPTVLPPSVAGLALLLTFGRRGLFGSTLQLLGVEIAFTTWAVLLAQLFVAAPYFIKNAMVGLSDVPPALEEAAALDGANNWQTLRHILVPLARRGIVSGLALTWARALGEFGATILFAGNKPGHTQTMPLAVYLGFEVHFEQALTLAVILLGISFAILASIQMLVGKSDD